MRVRNPAKSKSLIIDRENEITHDVSFGYRLDLLKNNNDITHMYLTHASPILTECVFVFVYSFVENGLLSYENPNYHLDPARLDDALNSNNTADEIYEDLYQELDDICNMGHKSAALVAPNRKTYAALDIGSMGVDINTGPQVTHIDSSNYPDNRR